MYQMCIKLFLSFLLFFLIEQTFAMEADDSPSSRRPGILIQVQPAEASDRSEVGIGTGVETSAGAEVGVGFEESERKGGQDDEDDFLLPASRLRNFIR